MSIRAHVLTCLFGLLPAVAWAQSAKIVFPPTISEVEFLRGRVTDFPLPGSGQMVDGVSVQLVGDKLQVRPRLLTLPTGTTGPARVDFDFDVGKLLSGSYGAELYASGSAAPIATSSIQSTPSANFGIRDLSGHWWMPSDPGWGLMIWHRIRDNALFSVWFTYDEQRKPVWLNFQPGFVNVEDVAIDFSSRALQTAYPVSLRVTQGTPLGTLFDAGALRVFPKSQFAAQPGVMTSTDYFVIGLNASFPGATQLRNFAGGTPLRFSPNARVDAPAAYDLRRFGF